MQEKYRDPLAKMKQDARMAVRVAIRSGKLKRKPCRVCGSGDTEAHHNDYTKPLKVEWLCTIHHRQHHVKVRRATGMIPKPDTLKPTQMNIAIPAKLLRAVCKLHKRRLEDIAVADTVRYLLACGMKHAE